MTTQLVHRGPLTEEPERDPRTIHTEREAAAAEVLVAAGAIALAIIGLAAVVPVTLMCIATIVVGAAQLTEANVGARGAAVPRNPTAPLFSYGEDWLGLRAEQLAGGAGVVLGVVALVGLIPVTLCSIALMGFGGALLLGSLARRQLPSVGTQATSGGEVLAGCVALVLGYLALIGFASVPLVLAGVLCVATALLMSGTTAWAYAPHRLPS